MLHSTLALAHYVFDDYWTSVSYLQKYFEGFDLPIFSPKYGLD